MGVREFIHNSRVMIRNGFPKGLQIDELELTYKEYYPNCAIPKPHSIIYGCQDWPTVFKNCRAFSEWFSVNKSKKILVLDKPEPNIKNYCIHNQYSHYNGNENELSSVAASAENSESDGENDGPRPPPSTKPVATLKCKVNLRTRSLSRSRDKLPMPMPIVLLEQCANKQNVNAVAGQTQTNNSRNQDQTEPEQSTSRSSKTFPKKQYKRIIPPPTSSSETDTELERNRSTKATTERKPSVAVAGPCDNLTTQSSVVPEIIIVKKEPGIECPVPVTPTVATVVQADKKIKLEEADLGILNIHQEQQESGKESMLAFESCDKKSILGDSVGADAADVAYAPQAEKPGADWQISDEQISESEEVEDSTDLVSAQSAGGFNNDTVVEVQARESEGDVSASESDQSSTPAKIPKMIAKHGAGALPMQKFHPTPSEPLTKTGGATPPKPSAEIAIAGTSRGKNQRSRSTKSTKKQFTTPAPFSEFRHPDRLHPVGYYDDSATPYCDYASGEAWSDEEIRTALKEMCKQRSCALCGCGTRKELSEEYAISHYNGGNHDRHLHEFIGNRGGKEVRPEEFKGNLLLDPADSNLHSSSIRPDNRKRKCGHVKKSPPLPPQKPNLWKEKCLSIWREAKQNAQSKDLAWIRNRTDYPNGLTNRLEEIGATLENGTCTSPAHFGKQMAYVLQYIRKVHVDPKWPGFANREAIEDLMKKRIPEVVRNFKNDQGKPSSTRP